MRSNLVVFVRVAALAALVTCTDRPEPTQAPRRAITSDVTAGDPVFVGAGDIAECDRHSYDTDTLLQGIPGTVWTAGDNAYDSGSDSNYTYCYAPTWGKEKARTYPAIGNHEYQTTNAAGYWNYFGTSFGYPGAYYSYNLGSWHIIHLNSVGNPYVSADAGSPQEQWLKADLAANQSLCTIAIWHHSRFYSPLSTTDNGVASWLRPFWVDLYNAGADVVLGGHEHQYERFAPQDPDGNPDPQTGIREFVVGTGGAGLAGPPSKFTSTLRNSEARDGVTWGVLKLTLHPTSYDWKFIPVKGQTFSDSGSTACHGTRPVVNAGPDQLISPNMPANLVATFTDYDISNPWNYVINWGDGATSSGTVTTPSAVDTIRASHTYPGMGQYMVSLTVTDNTGLTGSSSANVSVSNDNVIVGAGNTSRCDSQNDDLTANLLDKVPGTVITIGDNSYGGGSLTDFQNCYAPTWGRQLQRTRPTPGDKDYATSGAAGYFSYFGATAGDPTKGYYSYDLGAWHLIALNSSLSTSAGSTQETWLKADLAGTSKRCVLAYFHYPLFASQNGSQVWGSVQPLWNDLYAARADVVLGAHYQFYERFQLQTPAGAVDTLGGIREFVVGTGGQSWSSFGATPYPTSQVRSTQTWGVLKFTLHDTSYDWQFIPILGQTFTDAGTTTCHTKAPVASVSVSPTSATLQAGTTSQVTAIPLDAAGNPLIDRMVTWSSSNNAAATVSTTGLVTAVATGTATITAASGGQSGSTSITVVSIPVASVTVTPSAATILAGAKQQLTATPYDSNGNALTGRTVSWVVDNPALATVSATGLVTGVAPGSPTVTATVEGKSASSAITVNPVPVASVSVSPATVTVGVGGTTQLTATPRDSAGNPLTGRTIIWSSDTLGAATVSASGLVTGVAAGSATITATSEGKSGTSVITVAIPVASVSVSPSTATILVGATQQLTASALDAHGNALTGRTITWSTNVAGVASVSASGLVTAVAPGSATITAASEGKSGTAAITVNPVPVASVTVSPATATVVISATQQLTATPSDANGNSLSGRVVTWTTDNGAVATVSSSGLVTGVSAGTATMTATSEGVSGTSLITVPNQLPPVTLVGAGDIGRCDQTHDDSTAAIINGIAGSVFTAGNNVYSSGTLADFTNCYGGSWGQFLSRTRPAVGAKDYQTAGAAGYWQYFHNNGVAIGDSGSYYYSYDIGAWHVVVLNSEISTATGSPQEQWLKADLAASTKKCQLAIWSAPRFSSAGGTQIRSSVLPLWQDLYAAGAELVVNSHYRVYERFAPQTPGGVVDTTAGIRQFTVGTGGITPDTFNVALAPNSQVRATKLYGVLQLTLSDGSYSWQFKQVPQEQPAFTDSGTTPCH